MKKKDNPDQKRQNSDDQQQNMERNLWVDHRMETEQAEARFYQMSETNRANMEQLHHEEPENPGQLEKADLTDIRKQVVEQLKAELKLKAAVSLYMDNILVTLPGGSDAGSEMEEISQQVQRIVNGIVTNDQQQFTILVTTDKGHEEKVVKISKSHA